MAFDPELSDPISRVRFAVGDTAAVVLLPGGETTYEALLRVSGYDFTKPEATPQAAPESAAIRASAAALAVRFATQPDTVSQEGETVKWSFRVAQWNLIALGNAGGSAANGSSTTAKGFTLRRGPARDYTTGGGDAS